MVWIRQTRSIHKRNCPEVHFNIPPGHSCNFHKCRQTFIGKTSPDYFLQQSVAVLSHCLQQSPDLQQSSFLSQSAHFVESQHSFVQHSFLSQSAQHSVAALSAFLQLLQHEHDAAANIAATMAIDISTFFIIVTIYWFYITIR